MNDSSHSSTATPPTATTVPRDGWPRAWPTGGPDFETPSTYLITLGSRDAAQLAHILDAPENLILFGHTYRQVYANPAQLANLFDCHYTDPTTYGGAYAVKDRATSVAFGWVVVAPFNDSEQPVACTFFQSLGSEAGVEKGLEVFYILCRHCFDTLGHGCVEFRAGILDSETWWAGARMGFSLSAVLRRQIYVQDRSHEYNVYEVTREKWANMKIALSAWLNVKEA